MDMKKIGLILGAAFLVVFNSRAQAPLFDTVTVFNSDRYGYASTRDPAICITPKGTLLAFCEARADGPGDWASIDLLMRRSTDGGRTWNDTVVIAGRETGRPTSNLTPLVGKDGAIHLLYYRNYARSYEIVSRDDGLSWTPPVDITYVFDQFKEEYNWKVIASGPGHAIQLNNGRLIVPTWLCNPDPKIKGGHRPSCVASIYSDDHGRTWKRGAIIMNTSEESPNPSEIHAIELEDGRVMVDIRNESSRHRRMYSISPDGYSHWSKPVFNESLFEPICNASIERLSTKKKNGKSRILFCNPDSEADTAGRRDPSHFKRVNLTLRLSYDEGKTYPVSKVIDPGRSGYCDVVTGKDGMIYVFYEQGERFNSGTVPNSVVLARLNLAWLSDGKDHF